MAILGGTLCFWFIHFATRTRNIKKFCLKIRRLNPGLDKRVFFVARKRPYRNPPSVSIMATGLLSRGKTGRGVKVTTDFFLVLRLRMCGNTHMSSPLFLLWSPPFRLTALLPLSEHPSMHWFWQQLPNRRGIFSYHTIGPTDVKKSGELNMPRLLSNCCQG